MPFCSERCRQVDLLRAGATENTCIVEPLGPEHLAEELPEIDE